MPADAIQPSLIYRSINIAEKHQSEVTFLSVTEEQCAEQFALLPTLATQDVTDNLFKTQVASLKKTINKYKHEYRSISACNEIGIPFVKVIQKVQKDCYDLVMLAVKEPHKTGNSFFGSTAAHLMRKCPSPVYSVDINFQKPIKRIVAAIDVYAPTAEGQKLNDLIIQNAAKMAEIENAEIHVLHAWQLPSDNYLRRLGYSCEIERLEIVMKILQDRKKHMDQIITNVLPIKTPLVIKLLEGSAQEEIPKYVKEHDIGLVIMGTVCRTSIPGYFIGNTAESILSEISCSALTIKPEGFISPVNQLN